MALDNLSTSNSAKSLSSQSAHITSSQALESANAPKFMSDHPTRFCSPMFRAALEFYGLPVNYIRTFKQHPMLDKATQLPVIDKDGKQKMTLQACNVAHACIKEFVAVWTQINEPFEGAAVWTSQDGRFAYPKKAKNSEIQFIRNVVLDAEYPPDPSIAHSIAQKLVLYLVKQKFVEANHPIEDSGAGFHIGLPIVPIEIPADSSPETATLWNAAVASIVKTYIKPEFDRLPKERPLLLGNS